MVWEPQKRKDGSKTYNYYEASHYACKKKFEPKITYCDRNLCTTIEYSGLTCEDCIAMRP